MILFVRFVRFISFEIGLNVLGKTGAGLSSVLFFYIQKSLSVILQKNGSVLNLAGNKRTFIKTNSMGGL